MEKGRVVKEAGGAGMVLCNDASTGDDVVADPHLIAAAHCSYSQCVKLLDYLQSTDNPSGYIIATDKFDVKPAPAMAAFSSRGPNPITPQILKPTTLPLFDVAGKPCTCSQGSALRPEDLNYPSIAVPCLAGSTEVKRRVKNVGAPSCRYTVKVAEPKGVKVTVLPNELSFGSIGEEKEFTVKLDVYDSAAAADYVFGSIEWSDGTHRVRSPIVARTKCG
ncbi:hypothetical protein EJB05_55750 [Eragrostis curvula]|uniref:Subtilisin-like protease fibronectin type-III domain-containing protein n=1 Tax=Eragrostis curvula TaxID=38414 RepID=A0A5J9SIY8_9POAL|nr:hypothetical protein EJB05_55750 [Eragrostis curvula]